MRIGVVVCDFGGPQGPDELVPFLSELLQDVLPGPAVLKRVVAPLLARSRAKRVVPQYAAIGWSPLVATHHKQVEALRDSLGSDAPPMASGMMFTAPTMDDAVADLFDRGVDQLIALPMFPHYSIATTQAAFSFLFDALGRAGRSEIPIHWIPGYFDHPLYLEALAATIRRGIEDTPGEGPLHLLFTPHGLPLSFVKRGDPYPEQIRASVRAVIRHMGWTGPWHVGWQSRVGPVRWLEPGTPEVLTRLGSEGVERVCLVPVSFASEHVETLFEIDREYRHIATSAGIRHFGRAPALGLQPAFIACLAEVLRAAMGDLGAYRCVRCHHPKPDAHRRRPKCHSCGFRFSPYLRESR